MLVPAGAAGVTARGLSPTPLMLRIPLLLSVVALVFALWLLVRGGPSEKLFGSGLLVAIPALWFLWLGGEWGEPKG